MSDDATVSITDVFPEAEVVKNLSSHTPDVCVCAGGE